MKKTPEIDLPQVTAYTFSKILIVVLTVYGVLGPLTEKLRANIENKGGNNLPTFEYCKRFTVKQMLKKA